MEDPVHQGQFSILILVHGASILKYDLITNIYVSIIREMYFDKVRVTLFTFAADLTHGLIKTYDVSTICRVGPA